MKRASREERQFKGFGDPPANAYGIFLKPEDMNPWQEGLYKQQNDGQVVTPFIPIDLKVNDSEIPAVCTVFANPTWDKLNVRLGFQPGNKIQLSQAEIDRICLRLIQDILGPEGGELMRVFYDEIPCIQLLFKGRIVFKAENVTMPEEKNNVGEIA